MALSAIVASIFMLTRTGQCAALSGAWKNWQDIKTAAHDPAHATATQKPTPTATFDVDALVQHIDALRENIRKSEPRLEQELGAGLNNCSINQPNLSSETGLECLNSEEQFKDDYAKYVTRIKALDQVTRFVFGDKKWQGIYPSLGFTQAVKLAASLSSAIFFGDQMPGRHEAPHRFYIPSGREGEAYQGALDQIKKLADQEEVFRKSINKRYISNVCGKNALLPPIASNGLLSVSQCLLIEDVYNQVEFAPPWSPE